MKLIIDTDLVKQVNKGITKLNDRPYMIEIQEL